MQTRLDIARNGHIGEEGVILEQVADAALLWREVNVLCTVKQHLVIEADDAAIGLFDTRDTFEGHAFSRAGCTEQREYAMIPLDMHFQREEIEFLFKVSIQHHPDLLLYGFSTRLIHNSTTAEIAILISTHLNASSSLPVRHRL